MAKSKEQVIEAVREQIDICEDRHRWLKSETVDNRKSHKMWCETLHALQFGE